MTTLLHRWLAVRSHLSEDLFGGPRVLRMSWVINAQKGGTLPFVFALMWATGTWTATAWTYLALHGGYGLVWLLKDRVMPDRRWQRHITFGGALATFALVLGPYWLAPVLLVRDDTVQPGWVLAAASIVCLLGIVLMMCSDAQKHFTLAARPGLITTGFFSRIRHPNYLGEMVLYGAFAVVAGHWLPWVVLAWVWLGVFGPNMLAKEESMSRYPQWAEYQTRTGMLLPRLHSIAPAADSHGGPTADSAPPETATGPKTQSTR